MALKLRKDIKKSSYYVWFLGAKESKGLRGTEYILPVIKHLEEREKDIEPFKVTLQVSHKGLKIIQNIVSTNPKNSKSKNETIKHFIPHNTITCVYQHEDIIACILLLFNPVTKCPLHVHAYRCDSLETASLLKSQLQMLIEKPENQKKIAEIENRLKPPKELKKVESSIGSDTGTSTRESESSEERYTIENNRIATLYDSVAAELREKLGKKNSPILLPPRDYDTVHRNKGNLTGIELRRCLNANIVGQNVKGRIESSGGSSGIGSDHPPSPDSPDSPDSRFNTLDNQSTSDEEWNGDPADSSVYLLHPQHVSLSRSTREKSPESQKYSKYSEPQSPTKYKEEKYFSNSYRKEEPGRNLEKQFKKYPDKEKLENHRSLEREKTLKNEKERSAKTIDRNLKYFGSNSDKNFKDNSGRYYKSDRYPEYNGKEQIEEYNERREKYFESDGFDEPRRYRSKPAEYHKEPDQNYSHEDQEYPENNQVFRRHPIPKIRQKHVEEQERKSIIPRKYFGRPSESPPKFKPEDTRYYQEPEIKPRSVKSHDKYDRSYIEERSVRSQEYYDETMMRRKDPQFRQRSPSLEEFKQPRDRFKDAKEKFLLMEQERIENERRRPESPISPIRKEKFLSRMPDLGFPGERNRSKNNYDERYYDQEEPRPKPAPRNITEKPRYREHDMEPLERYRNTDKNDPKRRSMFSLIEEEHRKNSNEIARELKRRSYMDRTNFDDESERHSRDSYFRNIPDSENFLEAYSKSSIELDKNNDQKYEGRYVKNQKVKNSAGYRHSYIEPKQEIEKNGKKNYLEMLHRTNSSVSSNGRVGIASVHPY